MTHVEKIRPYFLILVLTGATVLTTAVFWPFLKPLALAAVFAVVLQGLYKRILRHIEAWPSVAALLTVLISTVVILLPLSLVGTLVADQAHTLYLSLENGNARGMVADTLLRAEVTLGGAVPGLGEVIHSVSADIDTYVKEALRFVTGNAGAIFSSVSRFLISFFIFFIALYYLLRDGKRVRQTLIELSPLNDREDSGVFDRLELAINSVIKGNLTIALIQGVLTTIGFALFGVPNAILWGTVAAVAALIPGIGTSLVLAPGIAYLFFTGATAYALGLLVWGVLAVGLVDNFLGPKLVGRGTNLHPLLVLLSVLGGLMFFGSSGIFLGPLSLSLLFALLSIYAEILRRPAQQ